MSKETKVVIVLLLIAGYGVYYLASSPQVQELFSSRPVPPELLNRDSSAPGPSQPEESAGDQPQDESAEMESSSQRLPPRAQPPDLQEPREPVTKSQTVDSQGLSDGETGRVLLQILAARKLATGVSLTVDADSITVIGAVPTVEARREILDVLDKGRGPRRIIADELIVDAPNNGDE